MLSSSAAQSSETPRGVIASALVFLGLGAYLVIAAVLIFFGLVSFTTGSWLLGGMETMGPVLYVLIASVAITIGGGLLRLRNWARRVASIAAGVVFVLSIPIISGAVAYSQIFSIAD